MTEIRNSKQCLALEGFDHLSRAPRLEPFDELRVSSSVEKLGAERPLCRTIEYWNLRFICNLVLGICDFRHKTPGRAICL